MKLQLLLDDHCHTCLETERVWRRVCEENGQTLEVHRTESETGRALAASLDLHMFPALIVDGRVRAVGAPTLGTARETMVRLMDQRADPAA